MSSCLDYLIQQEHEVLAIFSGEENSHTDHIWQFADQIGVSVHTEAPTEQQLHNLVAEGLQCIIAAEYPHKIPVIPEIKYSLNLHPTLLPNGRGQTPIPQLILHYPEHSGLSLHKLSDQLDMGDIVLQKLIPVDDTDSFDSLTLKMFIAAPYLLDEFFRDPISLYENATEQSKGSHWPTLTLQEQSISWQESYEVIEKNAELLQA